MKKFPQTEAEHVERKAKAAGASIDRLIARLQADGIPAAALMKVRAHFAETRQALADAVEAARRELKK